MRLIPGGIPQSGEAVSVNGRRATVVKAGFSTHVFRNDVSVKYDDDGTLDLIPLEDLELLNPEGSQILTQILTE